MQSETPKKPVMRRNHLLIAICILLAIPLIAHYILTQTTLVDIIKHQRHLILRYVKQNYTLSVAAFMGIYILITALSIPEAAVLNTTAGFLFGTSAATVYVTIAATIGATIAFILIRFFIGMRVQERYKTKLAPLNAAFEKQGIWYLLLVHCIPGIPFVFITMFAALTRVSIVNFIWTTALGIIPGTIVYAFIGNQFNHMNTKLFSKNTYIMGLVGIIIVLTLARFIVIKLVRHYKMHE